MKRFFLALIVVLMFSSLIYASDTVLRIAGGTAHLPIVKEVAKKFMEQHKDVKVVVSGGGSGVGIKQVGAGIVDIGDSGRDLKDSEIKKYRLTPHKIAIDGIAVVVNPSNKVSGLTLKQVQDIFSGKIKNWKDVGGSDANINVYSRGKESGTRKTFEKLALKKGKIRKNSIIVSSNGNMKVMIAQDKNGIGYLSVGYIDKKVKPLKIDNIYPSLDNIKKGRYKIQRYLYMVTSPHSSDLAFKFIDEVLSEYGQKVVAKHNFIPVK